MPKENNSLNQQQGRAVSIKSGPLLVIAGAGTGKTTVITRRIAHIISKKWAKPAEILALTFTEKAAEEMEERVDRLVPYGFVDTQISTFHAFGDKLLRDYAIEIGLPANFKILSETQQAIFMRQNLYAFDLKYFRPISNPIAHIGELLKHFSRLKDELVSPSEYIRLAQSQIPALPAGGSNLKSQKKEDRLEAQKTLELANAYQRYHDLMIQAGNLDYGDQIFLAHNLLKENPSVLKECQRKYKFILVDEFQDTNYAQYQIVKLLGLKHKNITVVGDDDQSIYRFRGASISNILSFKKDYPSCKQIVLNQNFRSTKQILDAAYKLIQHNNPDRLEVKNKINKKLISKRSGRNPRLIHCDTSSCEADRVAETIKKLKKEKGYKNRDFAILARANSHLQSFIQALNAKNTPNIFAGASSLFAQEEIRMLIAFFRCLAYDKDNLSFYQLATSAIYGASEEILAKYYYRSKRENKSYQELFAGTNDKIISKVISDIKLYREKIKNLRAGELLYEFLKDKKYLQKLTGEETIESEIKIANIAKFFERIYQFDQTADDKSLLAYLENLELIMSVGDEIQSSDIDPDLDAVNLLSVHAAKGLEWPVVFIVNAVSDRFPSRERRDKIPIPDELIKEKLPEGDFHLEEERRLFYVGLTRAKDQLFVSSADDYGGKRMKKTSQFVLEMFDDPNIGADKHKQDALQKIEKFKKPQTEQAHKHKSKTKVMKLSRAQIDDYFTCPKKYYFSNVLKIPLPISWQFMYGTAIHEAVGRYFRKKINGKKPDFKSLTADYHQAFKSEGFITREHEEEKRRRGIETLKKFYREDKKKNFIPSAIEERFEFRSDFVKIIGRFDLIYKIGDEVEILDFKTSDVTEQKDAEKRIRESTQMKIYALAWRNLHKTTPKTTLVFIESGLRAERKFTDKELEKIREVISGAITGIKKQNYTATPAPYQCQICPYHDICSDSAV